MNLTYLGTAAAEGWPALFCRCPYCRKALSAGGRNLRTRSQSLVNDDLLLDFPPDSLSHMQRNRLDFSAVRWLLVTHSHMDHFYPADLHLRDDNCYAHNLSVPTLDLYGNERVLRLLESERLLRSDEPTHTGVRPHLAKAFKPFDCGPYRITPLPANHAAGENALVYLVSDGKKTLLYLHDTGIPDESFFQYFRDHPIRADLISYDCTYVALRSGWGHLGLDSVPLVRKRLEELGVSDANTLSVINHFSHNGILIHDELVPEAEKLGFITAYDGLSLAF